jgi:hypothetical protein
MTPPVGRSGSQLKSYRRWLGVVVALVLSMLGAVVLLTLEPLERPASGTKNEYGSREAARWVEGNRRHKRRRTTA